jgi:hypothetical protein
MNDLTGYDLEESCSGLVEVLIFSRGTEEIQEKLQSRNSGHDE